MQALVVHDQSSESVRLGRELSRRGFMVATHTDPDRALDFIRATTTDLLVLKQVIAGRHTTTLALAAEHRQPQAATILLSDRRRQDVVELFELIPSLHAVLGPTPDGPTLAALAVHAIRSPGDTMLVLGPRDRRPAALRVA